MKVKCINAQAILEEGSLTLGKEYEVFDFREDNYTIENDHGRRLRYMKGRFVEIKSLEEQLEEAKALVENLTEQIEKNKIKVGDKFEHKCGDIYMIALVGIGQYTLVCVEGGCMGMTYGMIFYKSVEDCFGGNEYYFTKIK